jgi:hypothetical protein
MSGSNNDLNDAISNVVRQAEHKTATVGVNAKIDNGTLVASVAVENKTGHRFPSGVGFRRAFVELTVTDSSGNVVFSSGRTNANGEILGPDNAPLPTEYFSRGADGKQQYQPHFDEQNPVTSASEVQIFEELVDDADGNITESFIRRDHPLKDNRLLPRGWRFEGNPQEPLPPNWLEATRPLGVRGDPNYSKQLGGRARAVVGYRVPLHTAVDPAQLSVTATLWYQSWEPYFKKLRTTGDGPAATRLRVLLANLHPDEPLPNVYPTNTPLANWKLKISSATTKPSS